MRDQHDAMIHRQREAQCRDAAAHAASPAIARLHVELAALHAAARRQALAPPIPTPWLTRSARPMFAWEERPRVEA